MSSSSVYNSHLVPPNVAQDVQPEKVVMQKDEEAKEVVQINLDEGVNEGQCKCTARKCVKMTATHTATGFGIGVAGSFPSLFFMAACCMEAPLIPGAIAAGTVALGTLFGGIYGAIKSCLPETSDQDEAD